MNKNGIKLRNDYFRGALYIKLIVNNVKYGGILYDYGQLTKVHCIILESLHNAAKKDSDFVQLMQYSQVFNQVYAAKLKKAGCNLLLTKKCNGICRSLLAEAKSNQSSLNNGLESISLNKIHEMYVCQGGLTIQPVSANNVILTSWCQWWHGVKVGFAYNNSKEQSVMSLEQSSKSDGKNAESKAQKAICPDLISSIQHPASSIQYPVSSIQYPASSIRHQANRKNSTVVYYNLQSQKGSPVYEEALTGKKVKRLIPVIIDLPEERAIRACDLLRFFNN